MDAFLIGDLLAPRPMTPRPAGENPIWSPRKQIRLFRVARHARIALPGSEPRFGGFGPIASDNPRNALLPHPAPKGNFQAGYLPPPALAKASLQASLISAACDFMQAAIAPPALLASPHSLFSSALHALPTAAARMIAT